MPVKIVIKCDACAKEHHSPFWAKLTHELETEWFNENNILNLAYVTTEPAKAIYICNRLECIAKMFPALLSDLEYNINFDTPIPVKESYVSLCIDPELEYPSIRAKDIELTQKQEVDKKASDENKEGL